MTGQPDVQAAYAAYLNAWVEVENLSSVSEQSAAQAAGAQEAQYRLFEADKAHSEAWHAANGSVPRRRPPTGRPGIRCSTWSTAACPPRMTSAWARDEPETEPEAGS
jgi:hypothetical protein